MRWRGELAAGRRESVSRPGTGGGGGTRSSRVGSSAGPVPRFGAAVPRSSRPLGGGGLEVIQPSAVVHQCTKSTPCRKPRVRVGRAGPSAGGFRAVAPCSGCKYSVRSARSARSVRRVPRQTRRSSSGSYRAEAPDRHHGTPAEWTRVGRSQAAGLPFTAVSIATDNTGPAPSRAAGPGYPLPGRHVDRRDRLDVSGVAPGSTSVMSARSP